MSFHVDLPLQRRASCSEPSSGNFVAELLALIEPHGAKGRYGQVIVGSNIQEIAILMLET